MSRESRANTNVPITETGQRVRLSHTTAILLRYHLPRSALADKPLSATQIKLTQQCHLPAFGGG